MDALPGTEGLSGSQLMVGSCDNESRLKYPYPPTLPKYYLLPQAPSKYLDYVDCMRTHTRNHSDRTLRKTADNEDRCRVDDPSVATM